MDSVEGTGSAGSGDGETLAAWIEQVSSGALVTPWWLLGWCAVLERVLGGGVRACCAVPVRCGKTWTLVNMC